MAATQHRLRTPTQAPADWPDTRLELLRLRSELAALTFLATGYRLAALWRRANFNPDQPRNPAGMGDVSGEWVDAGASGTLRPVSVSQDRTSEDGSDGWPSKPDIIITVWPSNGGPPLDDPPPRIPPTPPTNWAAGRLIARAAVRWAARAVLVAAAAAIANPVGAVLGTIGFAAGFWLHDTYGGYIWSYLEAPKTLDQLQAEVSQPRQGTEVHHIVEQSSAEADGFSRDLIDGKDNLVRISTFKHWEINGYYSSYDDRLGTSPRNYLRGRTWEERRNFGLETLRRMEILSK